MQRKLAVRAACRDIASVLRQARSVAAARGRNVALRFRRADDRWLYSMYIDGDYDGVRNDDIAMGVDRRVGPELVVLQTTNGVARIGLPEQQLRDPDDGSLLKAGTSPVQFGVSQLCSFSPLGSSTAGSVFVTDGYDNAALVRVLGTSGRVRTMTYNFGSGKWMNR
jgi:hypothetical protein